jgi:hypothetical protein
MIPSRENNGKKNTRTSDDISVSTCLHQPIFQIRRMQHHDANMRELRIPGIDPIETLTEKKKPRSNQTPKHDCRR